MLGQLVYLDSCALQRPLDSLRSSRERVEAEAVVLIVEAVLRNDIGLTWSPLLDYECIESAPFLRGAWCSLIRRFAVRHLAITGEIADRGREFEAQLRLRASDALHLACAEAAQVPLVTVDRSRFLDRFQRSVHKNLVMDPLAFVTSLGL